MKKLTFSFLITMLLSTFVLPAARADQSVFVSGPDLTVTLPDELNYVLRDLPEDDPVWELFETDRESLLSLLAERNIYLYAFPEDLSFELDIVVTQSDGMEQFFDYNLYEDEELLDVFSSMGEEMLNENEIAFYDRSIYQSGEPKFIHLRFDHELDGLQAHSCTYTTAYNGIGVSISLHSFEGTYTREQDALLQSVVDSVRFQEKLSPSGATFAQ